MDVDGLVEGVRRLAVAAASGDSGGHDAWHVLRVARTAVGIAAREGADRLTVELAALCHDMKDYKETGDFGSGGREAREVLLNAGAVVDLADAVADIVSGVSFRGAGSPDRELTIEGQCVRDADRLDAIGAIGIARVFAYGGMIGRPIFDPTVPICLATDREEYRDWIGTSVGHFHEKLLLVRDRMSTGSGKALALERHRRLEEFLAAFYEEWGPVGQVGINPGMSYG